MQAREKKEAGKGKTQQKVQDESEDEIPLLVPIGTPAKENIEVFFIDIHYNSRKHCPWL